MSAGWMWIIGLFVWIVAAWALLMFNHGAHKDDADDDSR